MRDSVEVIGSFRALPVLVAARIVPLKGFDRNSRDLSGFCVSKQDLSEVSASASPVPPIACRQLPSVLTFLGAFSAVAAFFVPSGLAASASLASSSCVSVSRGFPGFLVRVAWSVPVPGELFCCGVCGGLLCVGGLLACASGVSVFGSVVPGALLLAGVPACVGGLRTWPRWFVRALPWRLLPGRFCREFPVAWRSAFGGWRVPVRCVCPAGSVRSGVSLLLPAGVGAAV
jgi:hypothetical protein